MWQTNANFFRNNDNFSVIYIDVSLHNMQQNHIWIKLNIIWIDSKYHLQTTSVRNFPEKG